MKVTQQNKEYASKGVGNAALVTGIVGAANALGVGGNGCGGGLFGNLLGGNNHDGANCPASYRESLTLTNLAIAQSEKYTTEQTKNDLERFYAEVRTTDEKINTGLVQTGVAVGQLQEQVKCLQREVDRNREESYRNLNESKEYTNLKVECESRERVSEMQALKNWTQAGLNLKVNTVNKVSYDDICGPSPLGCCGQ